MSTPQSELRLLDPEKEYDQNWKALFKSLFKLEKRRLHRAIIAIGGIVGAIAGSIIRDYTQYADLYVQLYDKLVDIFASLLGLAIAGYALFALLGDKDYLISLMRSGDKKNQDMPYFKVHLLYFIKFILVLSASLAMYWLFFFVALLQSKNVYIIPYFDGLFWISGVFLGLLTGLLLGVSAVETKSFIYNIYSMSLYHAIFQHNKYVYESKKTEHG